MLSVYPVYPEKLEGSLYRRKVEVKFFAWVYPECIWTGTYGACPVYTLPAPF